MAATFTPGIAGSAPVSEYQFATTRYAPAPNECQASGLQLQVSDIRYHYRYRLP
jgi:hypothetical protein